MGQMVWIQISTNVLSVLIWVQIVCKCYQQMTKVASESICFNAPQGRGKSDIDHIPISRSRLDIPETFFPKKLAFTF